MTKKIRSILFFIFLIAVTAIAAIHFQKDAKANNSGTTTIIVKIRNGAATEKYTGYAYNINGSGYCALGPGKPGVPIIIGGGGPGLMTSDYDIRVCGTDSLTGAVRGYQRTYPITSGRENIIEMTVNPGCIFVEQ